MGITQEQIHKEKARALDLVAQYRDGLYREPQLRSLFLELTMTCNSRCFHCGSRCEPGVPSGLPKEAYLQVLREVRDNFDQRHMMLCITGGEPMLYPDFFELMGEAKDMGFRWGMTTNGTLITREKARLLRETGMGTVSVSIDGLEKTHDRQRGLPGGYRLAMEGIQNLIDVGGFKTIQVTTVINHSNIDELDPLYEIFEKMDIDSWRVINLEPIGRALEYPDLMLTKEDYRRLFAFIYQKRMERMPVTYGCSHFLGLDLERELRGWYFFCGAGIHVASIMCNGDIGACLDIERRPETIQGNIFRDSFTDVWKNRFKIFRRPMSDFNEKCRVCPEAKWCAGDSRHSWDYEKMEPMLCFRDVFF
jgi:radical SAM protein with 4Fe4S-binding SPASM domain